jgi:hypothetical protein
MSLWGDHDPDMSPEAQFDDEAIEAIIRGDVTDASLQRLVTFARQVRAAGDAPAPRPSTELAALLKGTEEPGLRPVAARTPSSPSRSSAASGRTRRSKRRERVPVLSGVLAGAVGKVAGLTTVAKAALGTGVAVTALGTAGAVGVAPGPITDGVQGAITAATPLSLGEDDADATVDVDAGTDGASVGADAAGTDAGVAAETDAANTATGAVTGAVGEVDGVVDGATGTVGGVVEGATETVEGTTGPVVGDATEVVDGATETVGEVVDGTPVDDVVDGLPVGGEAP